MDVPQIDLHRYKRDFPELFLFFENPDHHRLGLHWGVGQGWDQLLWQVCETLEPLGSVRFSQVKETWGTLVIHTKQPASPGDSKFDTVFKILWEAQKASRTICEACGAPGFRRKLNGTVLTLCDAHGQGAVPWTGHEWTFEEPSIGNDHAREEEEEEEEEEEKEKLRAAMPHSLRVTYKQDEEGIWIARIEEVPGCHSYGSNLEEAKRNIREALSLCTDFLSAEEIESAELIDEVEDPAMPERKEKFDKSKISPGGRISLTAEQEAEFTRQEELADAEADGMQKKANFTPSRGLLVLDQAIAPAPELAQELKRRNIAIIIANLTIEDDESIDRMLTHRILVTSRSDFDMDATSFEYSIINISQVDCLPAKELGVLISRAVSALWGHPYNRLLTLTADGQHKLEELPG